MAQIKCKECGKEISDTLKRCPNCGIKLKQNYINKIIILIVICIFIFIGKYYIEKQSLHQAIMRKWERVEMGDTGSYYTLELDFRETTIEYNFVSTFAWLNSTIKRYDYKIINSHQIQIDNRQYEIRFNEDKTMMTITPSLTDSKSSENWFYHD